MSPFSQIIGIQCLFVLFHQGTETAKKISIHNLFIYFLYDTKYIGTIILKPCQPKQLRHQSYIKLQLQIL